MIILLILLTNFAVAAEKPKEDPQKVYLNWQQNRDDSFKSGTESLKKESFIEDNPIESVAITAPAAEDPPEKKEEVVEKKNKNNKK
jgi:hypothetical protein